MRNTAALNAYRNRLGSLLKASTLTPGRYSPSPAVRAGIHAAVLVDGRPIILCGPHDDPASVTQAEALAASRFTAAAFRAAGHEGAVTAGTVQGSAIDWRGSMAAVVGKPSGQVEDGTGDGPLVAIVLGDPELALTTVLCVVTETARALDPSAPDLDDGRALGVLSRAAA